MKSLLTICGGALCLIVVGASLARLFLAPPPPTRSHAPTGSRVIVLSDCVGGASGTDGTRLLLADPQVGALYIWTAPAH